MTTTTDPATELERLEAAAQEARQERDRLRLDASKYQAAMAQVEAEIGQLARTHRDQFDAAGMPKRSTKAAKLSSELEKMRAGTRWPELIAGAADAVADAEDAVGRWRADHAVELATLEYRRGEELVAKLSESAEAMLPILAELGQSAARLSAITAACPGRIDGRDVLVDGRLDQLRHALRDHANWQAPRSRSLTPFEGEVPVLLRGTDGGWIAAGHKADNYGEQPARIEPTR